MTSKGCWAFPARLTLYLPEIASVHVRRAVRGERLVPCPWVILRMRCEGVARCVIAGLQRHGSLWGWLVAHAQPRLAVAGVAVQLSLAKVFLGRAPAVP